VGPILATTVAFRPGLNFPRNSLVLLRSGSSQCSDHRSCPGLGEIGWNLQAHER
jgi:hypothetical protein